MQNCFYEKGLNFQCQRCSHCCKDEPGYVYLSKLDLQNLLACYNLKLEEFVQKYCRFVPFYDGSEVLCLQEKENYECILWKNGCTAYQHRPVQCSTYPFWSYILKDKDSWNGEAVDCLGINKGKLVSYEEIQKNRLQYECNFPIRKSELKGIVYEN